MPAPTPETLIDAVNERDEAIDTVPRGRALETGSNFRTAHVFVLNGSGEILLQRLAPSRERHPGRWGSSVAAYLFAGERYEEGAVRRLREELGLTVGLAPVGKLEMRDSASLKFVALFVAHAERAQILEPDHIAQLKFWPLGALEARVRAAPDEFTPTFAALFESFGESLK